MKGGAPKKKKKAKAAKKTVKRRAKSKALVPPADLLLYQTEDGQNRLEVRLEGDTVWLTQAQMAELFQTSVANVNIHIKGILRDEELEKTATIKESLIVQNETGRQVRRKILIYKLEMIIAVGYRVRSSRGTQFRQWATSILGEYAVKGFALDDERLKNPPAKGSPLVDHFNALLERIRDIRSSEKRMYLRVREIFALAADYSPSDKQSIQFFSVIQNKLHFAVTGKTAAELIVERVDSRKANMGLTHWQGSSPRRSDVTIAKNYLAEKEISELNRIVSMWLDFAEDQALRKKQVFLKDWESKLGEFLRFNDRKVLPHKGRVSKKQAETRAEKEYETFAKGQRVKLEQAGEVAAIEALEQTAKRLEKGKRGGKV